MASLPNSLATAQQITQQVGAMIPLGQISSVVQTLQNIQGFNAGAFSQLTGTIQSALTGINETTSIVQNFASGSPIDAFTNTLSAVGLAGSSVGQIAQAAGSAYQQADSFLNSQERSWQKLNSERPSVEKSREMNRDVMGNSNLVFPLDIGKYWISLSFEQVDYNKVMGSQKAYYVKKPTGSIILPVPINLVDTNRLLYKPISLTSAAAGGLVAGLSLMGKLGRGLKEAIEGGTAAIAPATDAASSISGLTVNTHQTLKFEQPTLKDHNFTWKLVPSSREEAYELHVIIEKIKANIYPRKNDLVFRYPSLVNVMLFNHDKLFKFKPAYVQGFSVNYTTEGGPAFHRDGYSASVQIDMSITENAVWTGSDFGLSEVTGEEALNLAANAGLGVISSVGSVFGGPR
jgi:hypothetical protein